MKPADEALRALLPWLQRLPEGDYDAAMRGVLEVLEKPPELAGAALAAFMKTAAKNQIKDERKRRKAVAVEPEHLAALDTPERTAFDRTRDVRAASDPEAQLLAREESEPPASTRRRWEALPDHEKQWVFQRLVGISTARISERSGFSARTVERAIRKMRPT